MKYLWCNIIQREAVLFLTNFLRGSPQVDLAFQAFVRIGTHTRMYSHRADTMRLDANMEKHRKITCSVH